MLGLTISEVNRNNPREILEIEDFLKSFSLSLDKGVDYTLAIRKNNSLVATCSKEKNILKSFAILSEYQGEGLAAGMVTYLMDRLLEEGYENFFVFTKPCNKDIFTSLGFAPLYQGREAVLLESGMVGIQDYLKKVIKEYNINTKVPRAALVMNCNPFTLGHRYLIEKAAEENEEVLVFLVEEDKSVFPYNIRLALLRDGVKDLPGVKVIPGGSYIISSATFPNYFIKEEADRLKAHSELDVGIFYKYIAKALNIKARYIGEEPYCNITAEYNNTLKSMAEGYDIRVIEVPRKKSGDYIISASSVRKLIVAGELEKAARFLPEGTKEFLKSPEGRIIIDKIKNKKNAP